MRRHGGASPARFGVKLRAQRFHVGFRRLQGCITVTLVYWDEGTTEIMRVMEARRLIEN
jgi:hypothetical protein